MTKKQRNHAEESFTLQFGEPDEADDAVEVDTSAGVFVDDNFMWQNAAAFLETSLSEGTPSAASPTSSPTQRSGAVDQDIETLPQDALIVGEQTAPMVAHPSTIPVPDGYEDDFDPEDNVEPLVVDERQAGMLSGPQDGIEIQQVDIQQEDVPDEDDHASMVLDERQMAMVTAPEAPDGTRFGEPDLSELRADPSEAVLHRGPRAREEALVSGDDPAGALFLDDDSDLPRVPSASDRGTKTPWIIYGTFGLGLAVLGVAAVGMVLQLGKPSEQPQGVGGVAASQSAAPAAVVASNAANGATTEATDLDPQMQVLRLAVGPFVDSQSNISVPARLNVSDYATPDQVAFMAPDAQFAPDLRVSLPVAVATETPASLEPVVEEADVVTVAVDRIELDLSDQQAAGVSEESVAPAIASVTIDPQVEAVKAPQLASVVSQSPEQSPQDERVSRGLFEVISQMSDDVAGMDAVVLENRPVLDALGDASLELATFDDPIDRAGLKSLAQFDLVKETLAGLLKPEQPVRPNVPVRLALADLGSAPNVVGLNAGLELAAFDGEPGVVAPLAVADVTRPEPNLPEPRVDVSRQLLAAVKLLEEEAARVLAGKTARPEELTKAAKLANSAEFAATPTPTPTPTQSASVVAPVKTEVAPVATATPVVAPVVPEGDAAVVADAPVAEAVEKPVEAVLELVQLTQTEIQAEPVAEAEPKKAEVRALAAVIETPRTWVSEAVWVPQLGFAISTVEQNGQTVLQVTEVGENSALPDWVETGAEILTVNGAAVDNEAAFDEALLQGKVDAASGLLEASMEIRARAGLDPRAARMTTPIWRLVTLGEGTEVSIKQEGNKWVSQVTLSAASDPSELLTGDILLRDFMTKNKLSGPLDVEVLFEAITEAKEPRVEFAVMRDGELASGGISLTQ